MLMIRMGLWAPVNRLLTGSVKDVSTTGRTLLHCVKARERTEPESMRRRIIRALPCVFRLTHLFSSGRRMRRLPWGITVC